MGQHHDGGDLATGLLIDLSQETRRQSQMLGGILQKLDHGARFHETVRAHMSRTDTRLASLEAAPRENGTLPLRGRSIGCVLSSLLAVMREIMPLSRWAAGAALIAASLLGHRMPAEIKTLLLTALGGH